MFSYENLRGGSSNDSNQKDKEPENEDTDDEDDDKYFEQQEDYELLNKQFANKDLKYIIKNQVKLSVA